MLNPNNPFYDKVESIYEFKVTNLQGQHVKLDIYKDHVCMVVNTATRSKLTDVCYKEFNNLIKKYGESQGFRILAFPCNQFCSEEPGTSEEIAKHAEKYDVKFDIYAKVDVNGITAIPLYKYIKKCLSGKYKWGDFIKSNYTKFIINKKGIPVERYGIDIYAETLDKILDFYFTKDEEVKP